ncbi:phosphotransferase family protein [Amycolatopsis magusensis]|uniref:phosphotransferase family protein n=1 Tax=Amycolatopsis magusensis TaxID=882444 RepID=UPI0037BD8CE7
MHFPHPERVLHRACTHAGLRSDDATPLRQHATDVFLLPADNAVARITYGPVNAIRATRAVTITRWLTGHGFPATEPLAVDQPVHIDDATVTFWHHYPQPAATPPDSGELGTLLRHLHQLPDPELSLPAYTPLADLTSTLASATTVLDVGTTAWITDRISELLAQFADLHSILGHGLIHGDAYPGNTLHTPAGTILGDWDEVAYGPRELDLANTIQGIRFGRSTSEIDRFTTAYGYDPRDWPGITVLTAMRDLHTLGAYLRRAHRGDLAARHELDNRITTLRQSPELTTWTAR